MLRGTDYQVMMVAVLSRQSVDEEVGGGGGWHVQRGREPLTDEDWSGCTYISRIEGNTAQIRASERQNQLQIRRGSASEIILDTHFISIKCV